MGVLRLYQQVGHQLVDLKFVLHSTLDAYIWLKPDQVRVTCPQVNVRFTSKSNVILPVMQALRDSLVELHLPLVSFSLPPNRLAECTTLCHKLESVALYLHDNCAAEFLEKLLSHIGLTLHKLDLSLLSFESLPPFRFPAPPPPYFTAISRFTGNLRHLVTKVYHPGVSLRAIARSNPELRHVVVILSAQMRFVVASQRALFGKFPKWLSSVVDEFVNNFLHLEDVIVEDFLEELRTSV